MCLGNTPKGNKSLQEHWYQIPEGQPPLLSTRRQR